MFAKLEAVENRYDELARLLSDPDVVRDQEKYRSLTKEHADLTPLIEQFRELKTINKEIEESQQLLDDSSQEIREMAKIELESLKERKEEIEEKLKILLLPKDPRDEKNIFLEIRAGTGGEEAALFAADLFRMYTKYSESQRWKVEIMSTNYTGKGGFKELIAMVTGKNVFSKLKYESGVHRVQRVPVTEASGRIHTSAVTVAILPEAEDVEVQINDTDLRVDVFRASGPGGQSVNTTDSAVRITHLPTGLVVACQDEKSQHKNKAKALKILKARLYDKMLEEQQAEISADRRAQVGSGDRSERIRTYNFPQGRVTDHRVGLTLHKLESILDGDLTEVIDALTAHFQSLALKGE